MRRQISLAVAAIFMAAILSSCAPPQNQSTYEGAGAGGAIGAAAGMLLDSHNRWRGAVLGGVLGALLGGSVTDIASRASQQAAQRNQTVTYTSQDGSQRVVATPVASNAETKCHKVRERIYENGRLVKDQVKEICESNKTTPTY